MAVFREHRCGCVTAEGKTSNGQTVVIVMECDKLREQTDEFLERAHSFVVKIDEPDEKVEFMRRSVDLMERGIWEEHIKDEGRRVNWDGTRVLEFAGSRSASSKGIGQSVAATPCC